MLNKTSFTVSGVLLLCSLATTAIAKPASAESPEMLISQLRGHETYKKEEQMNLSEYTLGKVRGRAGNLLSVELMDMSSTEIKDGDGRIIMEGSANPGDDVLLKEEDGDYELVGPAHPAWITKLQKDYKWKMSGETGSATSRTTSVDREREMEPTDTVTPSPAPVPEPQQTEPAPAPQTKPEEPVRGMW